MGEREIRTNQPIDVVQPVALDLAPQRCGHQPPLAALPDQTVRLTDQGAHLGSVPVAGAYLHAGAGQHGVATTRDVPRAVALPASSTRVDVDAPAEPAP